MQASLKMILFQQLVQRKLYVQQSETIHIAR